MFGKKKDIVEVLCDRSDDLVSEITRYTNVVKTKVDDLASVQVDISEEISAMEERIDMLNKAHSGAEKAKQVWEKVHALLTP